MGKSKYGLSRTIKVVFDLMTIKFMASYQTKPIYVFGTFGLIATIRAAGVDSQARAEQLPVADFVRLANHAAG